MYTVKIGIICTILKSYLKSDGLVELFSSGRAIVKKHKKAEAEATTFLESSVYALSEKRLASNVGLEEDRERSCSPDQTHKDLYEDFKNSEAMTTPISFSHFTKCRPAQVRLM